MGELPEGTVTMLFTDIEGSTALLSGLGERYGEALSAQRALLRAAFSACGGQELGTEGDSFFVVFASAGDAVRCCVAAQRALCGHDWPGGVAVRVRMGLHSGEPVRHEDGYVGLDVHRAARIAAAAHGGQVVLSEAVRLLVAPRLPPGVSLRDLGHHRLKDIEAPERVYQVVAAGLPEQFPPLKSLGVPVAMVGVAAGVHGVPPALTSFVGRASELDEVAGLLAGYRMVTVTGPGGVGKTRLAGEVARRVAGRFADGVWLAELAGAGDPARVPVVVAAALGLREAPGVPVMESLVMALAVRQVLLVLDNCEHVLGAVAQLCGGLLPAADDVQILATSREPVAVPGEARYRLPPLGLPEPEQAGEAGGSEAVELFAARARQADPRFTLAAETIPAVARLVERLDGMPLAIELAAARVEALGAAGLAERLDDRFRLLAGGDRLAAARHRSLAATADWSYQLLAAPEQRVFRKLAVFSGPFTLEAAETVAGADAGMAVLRLVNCSLLVPPRVGPDGRSRYQMLATLRAYGSDRLAETGEEAEAAAALARFAVEVAEQAAAGLQTSTEEVDAARWLDAEDATMHHVLAWALERDPAVAVRLAIALAPWWWVRSRWAAGYDLLAAAVGRAGGDGEQWCTAQFWLGCLAGPLATGHREAGLGHLTAARDALTARVATPLLARVLAWRAGALANLGHLEEAAQEADHALALARQLGDACAEVEALFWLAAPASYAGDHETALACMRQAQRIDPAGVPGVFVRGCHFVLAGTLVETGEFEEARLECARELELARQAGEDRAQAEALGLMAQLDLLTGQAAGTRTHLRDALQLLSRQTHTFTLLDCLDLCGQYCAQSNRWREALTVWAAYGAWLRDSGTPDEQQDVIRHQERMSKARQALGPGPAKDAEHRGTAMTLATAAEFAALLVADHPAAVQPPPPSLGQLSPRERELVTLIARGRTNAQIAAQLSISVNAVRSQLDRIRDKTGCRRRIDLTRLALQAGLV